MECIILNILKRAFQKSMKTSYVYNLQVYLLLEMKNTLKNEKCIIFISLKAFAVFSNSILSALFTILLKLLFQFAILECFDHLLYICELRISLKKDFIFTKSTFL